MLSCSVFSRVCLCVVFLLACSRLSVVGDASESEREKKRGRTNREPGTGYIFMC